MRNERVIKIKMHGMKKQFRILGPEDTIQEGDLQYYPSFNAHRPLEKKQKIADVSTEEIQGWLVIFLFESSVVAFVNKTRS